MPRGLSRQALAVAQARGLQAEGLEVIAHDIGRVERADASTPPTPPTCQKQTLQGVKLLYYRASPLLMPPR
ncbi:MAG: hypothetical protein EXQ59_03990 [Acidobacteria bacterium]|nr:hypothetical protein [Acidobacteriota bacterium]